MSVEGDPIPNKVEESMSQPELDGDEELMTPQELHDGSFAFEGYETSGGPTLSYDEVLLDFGSMPWIS